MARAIFLNVVTGGLKSGDSSKFFNLVRYINLKVEGTVWLKSGESQKKLTWVWYINLKVEGAVWQWGKKINNSNRGHHCLLDWEFYSRENSSQNFPRYINLKWREHARKWFRWKPRVTPRPCSDYVEQGNNWLVFTVHRLHDTNAYRMTCPLPYVSRASSKKIDWRSLKLDIF